MRIRILYIFLLCIQGVFVYAQSRNKTRIYISAPNSEKFTVIIDGKALPARQAMSKYRLYADTGLHKIIIRLQNDARIFPHDVRIDCQGCTYRMNVVKDDYGENIYILQTAKITGNKKVLAAKRIIPDSVSLVNKQFLDSLIKSYQSPPDVPGEKISVPDFSYPLEMVLVEGGSFYMGCSGEQGKDCEDDEKNLRQVSISRFYISRYEVTQKLFEAVMKVNPSHFKNCPDCPVETVNWEDAMAFCEQLSKLTKRKFTLPTEAQWEYAARGGVRSRRQKYAGADSPDIICWYDLNSSRQIHPVGQKNPNELGLYDMSGNAWEWCLDNYGRNYPAYGETDPTGPESGTYKVLRGGSWGYRYKDARVSNRFRGTLQERSSSRGFRIVMIP